MYVEQLLRGCEVCNRRFAVQYAYGAPRVPDGSERVVSRLVSCPSCGHGNPLVLLMYAYDVTVKAIPGPDPVDVRVRPTALRQIWATSRPRPKPRTTAMRRIRSRAAGWVVALVRRVEPLVGFTR